MSIIGNDSRCILLPPQSISIEPEIYPSLEASIEIREKSIECRNSTESHKKFVSSSKQISAPFPPPAPNIRLTFANFTSCSPLFIDASETYVGRAPLIFNWKLLQPIDNSTRVLEEILQNTIASRIFIPFSNDGHDLIRGGTEFTIRVNVTNHIGVWKIQDLNITKMSGNPPIILLNMEENRKVFSALPSTFDAEAFQYTCDGSKKPAALRWQFSWKDNQLIEFPSQITQLFNQPKIVLPPNTFRSFIKKNITILVYSVSDDGGILSHESRAISILASPISLVLHSANTIISSSSFHTLEVSIIDPDEALDSTTFEWIFTSNHSTSFGNFSKMYSSNTTSSYLVSPGEFPEGENYILVKAINLGRIAFANGWLRVVNEDPLPVSLSISPNGGFIDVSTALSVQVESDDCRAVYDCVYSWSLVSYSSQPPSSMVQILQQNMPRLVFEPNSLAQDSSYVVSVNVTRNNCAGYSEIELKTSPSPHGGSIEIFPEIGKAIQTEFEISARGWITEQDTMPLWFDFSYQQNGRNFISLPSVGASSVKSLLPGGDICLRVVVTNRLGGRANSTKCASVEELSTDQVFTAVSEKATSMFNDSRTIMNDVNSVLMQGNILLGIIDSVSQRNHSGGQTALFTEVAKSIIGRSSIIFSQSPITESSILSVASIILTGSRLLNSTERDRDLELEISNTTNLIIGNIRHMPLNSHKFGEVLNGLYSTLDFLVSRAAISSGSLRKGENVEVPDFPSSTISQILSLQSIQSESRICGENDYLLELESLSFVLSSGQYLGSRQSTSLKGVTISHFDDDSMLSCAELSINMFPSNIFDSSLKTANQSSLTKVALLSVDLPGKARSNDKKLFNATLEFLEIMADHDIITCSFIDSVDGTISDSICKTIASSNASVTCECSRNGAVFGRKRTQFASQGENDDETEKSKSGTNSVVLISCSISGVVLAIALIVLYRKRHSKKQVLRILVSESDSQSSHEGNQFSSFKTDSKMLHPDSPNFKQERSQVIQVTETSSVDFEDDELDTELDNIPTS